MRGVRASARLRRGKTCWPIAAVAAACLLAACGTSTSSTGGSSGSGGSVAKGAVVNVGVASTLSGTFAALGRPGEQGIALGLDQINHNGGLLGHKLKLYTADDQIDPATGATVTRKLILDHHVKALFGSVSSAVALGQLQLAVQYKVPLFLHMANDIGLTTKHYAPEVYDISPNTDIEPASAALAVKDFVGSGPLRLATIAPDYSYGTDSVTAFLADLKKDGVRYTVTDRQLPQLGATSYTSNLTAILATNPQLVYSAQYGADLSTLTKQAEGLGLFKKARMIGMYGSDVVKALMPHVPAGIIAWDRAASWVHHTAAMTKFIAAYKARYHTVPDEWALIGYDAAMVWAAGVRKAGSFSPAKLSTALSGATVPTAIGNMTIRACDHQAEVADDTGVIGSHVSPEYGIPLWSKTYEPPVSKVIDPCDVP